MEADVKITDDDVIHFPVIILYDEIFQSDFIQDFGTNTTFKEQLGLVLSEPAPWDPSHKYNIDNIEIYYETNISELIDERIPIVKTSKKYEKIELSDTLESIITRGTCIVPQYPVFNIIAKDCPDFMKYRGN